MSRKQYRGVMVFDFDVDGSFRTVADLQDLWEKFAEEMGAKISQELPQVKAENPQAELQDRRGKTGDIKNIVFRGGRGTNEKMSKSQMLRLEELWTKRWLEMHLNSDPRADLKGEERKLYNRLNHMAEKEGLEIDESLGRLRNAKSDVLAYPDGKLNHSYRFQRKVWEAVTTFNYSEVDDEMHGDIMRKILTGDIEDLDQHILHWESNAHHHMPTTEGNRYQKMVQGKEQQLVRRYERPSIRKAKGAEKPENYAVVEADLGPAKMRGKETFEFNKPGGKKTIVRTIKFPVGTLKFDGQKASFLASKRDFRNKLVHMASNKERNDFLNDLLKKLLKAEKSETVSRITRVIKQAKEEPTEDKFDDIWQTMDFKSMQGQKAN